MNNFTDEEFKTIEAIANKYPKIFYEGIDRNICYNTFFDYIWLRIKSIYDNSSYVECDDYENMYLLKQKYKREIYESRRQL